MDVSPFLLAAGFEGLCQIAVVILVIAGYAISHLVQASQASARKQAARQRPAGPPRDALEDEVEQFLRENAGKRGGPPPEIEILDTPTSAQSPPSWRDEPMMAEVVPHEPFGGDVTSHVTQHLDTHDISDHASRLGAHIDQADERLSDRLQSVFDHDLGQLGDSSDAIHEAPARDAAAAEVAATAAAKVSPGSIVAVFRNPQNIRQAIILSEILNRPEERW